MCFSAEVSFGAAAVLGVAGISSLRKVNHPRQIMFAALPIVFGVQQACEGILWLSLSHASLAAWQRPVTFLFLFFAQVLWTTWIPTSFLMIEQSRRSKQLLWIAAAAGLLASLLLGYRMLFYPVDAQVDCNHILYNIGSPQWIVTLSSILYVVAIILPPFISTARQSNLLGLLLTGSLVISKVAYEDYLISVWCFFAALLSVMIVYMMRQFQQAQEATLHGRHFTTYTHQH